MFFGIFQGKDPIWIQMADDDGGGEVLSLVL
jgi:hypothetical protein